ncbi:hypothetical protein KGY79_12580 [Candidatus Bipolaricaulota bacterium]|nr:hypothetical protein [Candidatus Bipolaricaulota bacterium]
MNLNFEVNETGIEVLTESSDPKRTSQFEYRALPLIRSVLGKAVGVVVIAGYFFGSIGFAIFNLGFFGVIGAAAYCVLFLAAFFNFISLPTGRASKWNSVANKIEQVIKTSANEDARGNLENTGRFYLHSESRIFSFLDLLVMFFPFVAASKGVYGFSFGIETNVILEWIFVLAVLILVSFVGSVLLEYLVFTAEPSSEMYSEGYHLLSEILEEEECESGN